MTADTARMTGTVRAQWHNPAGELIHECITHNLITQVGDQLYMERGAGIVTTPVPTGMKLGTGTTAPAKTGAGAALVTYLADSDHAFEAGFPASSLNGAARRIQYKCIYAAGEATSASPITEVVIVNTALADSTSLAAATIARALLSSPAAKGADDTLTITWSHDAEGE